MEQPKPDIDSLHRRERSRRRILGWGAGVLSALAIGSAGYLAWLRPGGETGAGAPQVVRSEIAGEAQLLGGHWGNLPGAYQENGGLKVSNEGFAIVRQDGTPGEINPPVNLFGTRLQAAGSFQIDAGIRDRHGPAMLQLYGEVPIIADEFRVERQSVRLTVDDSQFKVELWNGSSQTPSTTQVYPIPDGDSRHITMMRDGGMLSFAVDGHDIGSIKEDNVFNSGQVWFGTDGRDGSWTLANLSAKSIHGDKLETVDMSAMKVPGHDPEGLQTLAGARRPGFLVGAAMALGPMMADGDYARVALGGNFRSMTPENAMKMQFTQPQKGVFDFHEADALVTLAQRQGLVVHGHALVFAEANPMWLNTMPTTTATDKAEIERVMLNHITTEMTHFKTKFPGMVKSWDVVNEPLDDDGNIRNHIWYKAMGEEYIAKAFRAARAADPDAMLCMNQYGLESGNPDYWDTFLGLVTKLKSQGVPIDCVGMQAHVYQAGDRIDMNELKTRIRQLANIGVKVRISEMDVYSDDGDTVQANQFADVFNTCMGEANCVSFTTWGISDRYDYFKDDDGSIQQGEDLLWDNNMQPRPALRKIRSLFGLAA